MTHIYKCPLLGETFEGATLCDTLNKASQALKDKGFKTHTVKGYSDLLHLRQDTDLSHSSILGRLQRSNKRGLLHTCVIDSKIHVIDSPENIEIIKNDKRFLQDG
tara:strand:+ start:358 stop:672 length:315 start_codon:yes stop_codon:yes gene_type:complete